MNRDDDFIEQLEDYLATYEGVVPLPASVRESVSASLPVTRQVRRSRGPERMLNVVTNLSVPARWGIGIAASLVVLVGAAALFTGGSKPGIGAAPTPTPSSSPTTSPSADVVRLAEASPESCFDGVGHWCLRAGRYRLSADAWPGTISFDVPSGWFRLDLGPGAEGLIVESGQDAIDGSGWGPSFMTVGAVSKDPCDPGAGQVSADETATVDGLISAMRSWPGFEVSASQPVEVDGHAGQLVTISSTRTGADCATQSIWTTDGGATIDAYPMVGVAGQPRTGTFRIVDVDGTLVVIRTTDFGDPSPHELAQGVEPDPTRHAADQVELQSILDSIRIGS